MTDLASLIERIEAGDGADRELSAEVLRLIGDGVVDRGKLGWTWRPNNSGVWLNLPDLMNDLNAVIALCERVLPGMYQWVVTFDDEPTDAPYDARVFYRDGDGSGGAKTPARALLAALLRAKEGQP